MQSFWLVITLSLANNCVVFCPCVVLYVLFVAKSWHVTSAYILCGSVSCSSKWWLLWDAEISRLFLSLWCQRLSTASVSRGGYSGWVLPCRSSNPLVGIKTFGVCCSSNHVQHGTTNHTDLWVPATFAWQSSDPSCGEHLVSGPDKWLRPQEGSRSQVFSSQAVASHASKPSAVAKACTSLSLELLGVDVTVCISLH